MHFSLSTLQSLRNDSTYNLLWKRVCASFDELDVEKSALPHCRKVPPCLDEGSASTAFCILRLLTWSLHALQIVLNSLDSRHMQKCKHFSLTLPHLNCMKQSYLLLFHSTDQILMHYSFEHTLKFFSQHFKSNEQVTLSDIISFFCACASSHVELISQVGKLVMLLLVMPATNAQSEKSFSAVRRIKTNLRSTMSQQYLYHLMLLHVHKSQTDELILIDVANDFIDGNNHGKNIFGSKCSQSDYDSWVYLQIHFLYHFNYLLGHNPVIDYPF